MYAPYRRLALAERSLMEVVAKPRVGDEPLRRDRLDRRVGPDACGYGNHVPVGAVLEQPRHVTFAAAGSAVPLTPLERSSCAWHPSSASA